ncbi:zinc finger protein 391-like [Hermetia illucens]|nr:zinc finger protein 391-like [Hermetia illucens]
MSLLSIEFVDPESLEIKNETIEEDISNAYSEKSCSDSGVPNAKCGEIFTSSNCGFILMCAFCGDCYRNIPEFGEHLHQHHKNQDVDFYESLWDSENEASVDSFGRDEEHDVDDCEALEEEFECETCKKQFVSHRLLEQHKCQSVSSQHISETKEEGAEKVDSKHPVKNESSNSKWSCNVCNEQCPSQQLLRQHKCKLSKKSKEKSVVKDTPDNLETTEESSQQIPEDHSDFTNNSKKQNDLSKPGSKSKRPQGKKVNPDFYCEICDQLFSYKSFFRKHGMRHAVAPIALQNDPEYLKCHYCGLKLANNAEWYDHENSHTEDTKYKCPCCPKSFKRRYQLKLHANSHTGDRPYKCPHCKAAFSNPTNMQTHVKRVHLRLMPHECTLCDKKFVKPVELTIHMRQHTGEKPYQCEECGKKFILAVQLNEHRRRHANLRDAKCPLCPMAFNGKKMLSRHMVKHSDLRPHKCATCGQAFSRKNALVAHTKIHQDFKEYVCPICGKAFAQRAGLYSHKKSHVTPLNS